MIEFDIDLALGSFRLSAKLQSDARVIGLFGPSGSGKSTLLATLAGTLNPSRGKIVINGKCLLDTARGMHTPIHQRRIGMVYQDGKLFPHLSVRNNLTYGMRLLKAPANRFKLDQIVSLLEIEHLLDNRPNLLSGGERQRVALGRALLASPEILLLDEPMASLDERLKGQILPFLRRIKEEISVPMIYVSHSMTEIVELTQQLAVIQNGSILACGNFHDVLISDPVLPLAHSLGLENVVSLRLIEHNADLGYSEGVFGENKLIVPFSQAPLGTNISVVIPASNIALSLAPIEGITIQNQIRGRVTSIRTVGHRTLVSIDVGTILLVEITEKSVRDLGIGNHQTMYCLIKAQSIRILGKGN